MRGVVFTIDAVYALIIAMAAVGAIAVFLSAAKAPDYGFVDSMKAVHDMGEDDTALPPPDYSTACDGGHMAVYYLEDISGESIGYDYGDALRTEPLGVCAK